MCLAHHWKASTMNFDQAVGDLNEKLGITSKVFCDFFVGLSTAKLIIVPATAILTGELYGPTAFLCGAIIVSAVSFCELYCRRDEN